MTSLSYSQTTSTTSSISTDTTTPNTEITNQLKSGDYPIILKYDGKTLVCFTIEQARQLAKDVTALKADEEIIIQYENKETITKEIIKNQQIVIETQKKEIDVYKSKENDYNALVGNKDQEIDNLNTIAKRNKWTIIKLKIATFVGFTLAAVLPVAVLVIQKK